MSDAIHNIRTNEKFIRDFTIYEVKRGNSTYMYYKEGGLTFEEGRCWYKPGFILPSDFLYYRCSVSDLEIKEHPFNDLVVYAIEQGETGGVAERYFEMLLRSISTGEFFVIQYTYSSIYLPRYYEEFGYPFYLARKLRINEEDLIEESINDNSVELYNYEEYKTRHRNYKIDRLLEVIDKAYS